MVRGSLTLTYEVVKVVGDIQSVRIFSLETKSDISDTELEVLLRRMKKADEPDVVLPLEVEQRDV